MERDEATCNLARGGWLADLSASGGLAQCGEITAGIGSRQAVESQRAVCDQPAECGGLPVAGGS